MGVIPRYPNDVFVSYAHVDNQPIGRLDIGWVTDFRNALEALLKRRFPKVECWKDDRMRVGEVIDKALEREISASAVLVMVISRGYLRSQFCTNEREAFCSAGNNWHGRIVGVAIDETPLEQFPEPARAAKSIKFTVLDEAARTERTLPKPDHYDPDQPYWKALADVVDGISIILERLQRPSNEPLTPVAVLKEDYGSLVPVYLAEVTDDLLKRRSSLLSILERGSTAKGLSVEPRSDSADGSDVLATCSDAIARSKISVHLVSDVPGRAWQQSLTRVQMQLERAVARSFTARPIVWVPPELQIDHIEDEEHRKFLQSIRGRVELIQINFDQFVLLMQARFFPAPTPIWRKTRGPQSLIVYIAHCRQRDAADLARQQLQRSRCAAVQLDHCTERDAAPRRHEVNVKNCDGMVILYDPRELPWAEELAMDAWRRAQQLNRPRYVAAVATAPLGDKSFGFHYDRLISLEATSKGRFDSLDHFMATLTESDDV